MKTVLQVEFSPSRLLDREAVLKRAGYQVISVLGSSNARSLDVSDSAIGVIVVKSVAQLQLRINENLRGQHAYESQGPARARTLSIH